MGGCGLTSAYTGAVVYFCIISALLYIYQGEFVHKHIHIKVHVGGWCER